MDDPNDKTTYRFLAGCARADVRRPAREALAQAAAAVTDWAGVPAAAENHGLAPLVVAHCKATGIELPPETARTLRALCIRHRLNNRVRMGVLREVLDAYATAEIDVWVLKGAALAHLVYAEPGLRPMRDLDVLVYPGDAVRAQRVLAQMGFEAPLPPGDALPDKHMLSATLERQGFTISIEVHHNLFDAAYPASMTAADVSGPPLEFTLARDGGQTARALGYEDMLWHLSEHLRLSSGVFDDHRLIWIADVVGFAERFVEAIDWGRMRSRYPRALRMLSLLHTLTPLSAELLAQLAQAGVDVGPAPRGIGRNFAGWPRYSLAAQRDKGWLRILHDTVFPAEWWLRLYYALGSARPIGWCRYVRHPLHIMRWVGDWIKRNVQTFKRSKV